MNFAPFEVTLPMPPPANNLYPTNYRTGKRFKSKEYENWLEWASHLVKRPAFAMDAPIYARYEFQFTNNRRTDIVGREKALSDFFVQRGIIRDDCLIHHFEAIRLPNGEKDIARVTLKPLGVA